MAIRRPSALGRRIGAEVHLGSDRFVTFWARRAVVEDGMKCERPSFFAMELVMFGAKVLFALLVNVVNSAATLVVVDSRASAHCVR